MSEENKDSLPPPERLSKLVRRLRAPNPGPMTLTGTNSYLIGTGSERVVLDPGPVLENHLQALVAAVQAEGAKISLILVTHGHPDHYPGAARLSELTGAPVAAHHSAHFPHQQALDDGQRLSVAGVSLLTIYTPGHAPDHLCYYLEEEKALFSGDNILGTGTTVVAPPKGDMANYMASLRLLEENWGQAQIIYGGHGPEISEPKAKFREYILHRLARQQQLTDALATGPATVPQLVERIYQDVDRRLWPAAARQVLAYLIMLEREGQVTAQEINPAELSTGETAILHPTGPNLDPVAAAELGISGQDGPSQPIKRYTLVS